MHQTTPPDGISLADVLRLDIPAADRIRIATLPGALPDPVLCRWLGRVVRRALGRVPSPGLRSLAVLPELDAGRWPGCEVRDAAEAEAHDAEGRAVARAAARFRASATAYVHEADDPTAEEGDDDYSTLFAARAVAAHAAAAATTADPALVVHAAAFVARAAARSGRAVACAGGHTAEYDQQVSDLLELLGEGAAP